MLSIGINEINPDIREYLYYRFTEKVQKAGNSRDSSAMTSFGREF